MVVLFLFLNVVVGVTVSIYCCLITQLECIPPLDGKELSGFIQYGV